MRARHITALLLSLALLLGQLGGIAHAASHLKQGDQDRPHAVCELCVAYAAFDAGATVSIPPLPARCRFPVPNGVVAPAAGEPGLPPYASHAPPHLV